MKDKIVLLEKKIEALELEITHLKKEKNILKEIVDYYQSKPLKY